LNLYKWASPGLCGKVLDFCKIHGRIDLIAERKEKESHTHQRSPVQGRVKAVLLDASGQKTRVTFNGELAEMSRSGTSFSIHCNNKELVKQLLTRSFSLAFTFGVKGKELRFSNPGKVVRLFFSLFCSGTALDRMVQAFSQSLIVSMGGHVGGNAASDRETEQVEISDKVQYLVAYEFVRIAEFCVDDFTFMHDDMRI